MLRCTKIKAEIYNEDGKLDNGEGEAYIRIAFRSQDRQKIRQYDERKELVDTLKRNQI